MTSRTTNQAVVHPLEPRVMLAADLTPRGLLIITGTPEADAISVDVNLEEAAIVVSGATPEEVSFPAARVRAVIVRAGGGDDVVGIGELPHRTLVSLGEGDDSLLSSARFTHAAGGPGNDELTVLHEEADPAGAGSGPRPDLRLNYRRFAAFGNVLLAGGDGDDTITGSVRARFNNLAGGLGDDALSVPANARGRARMNGGEGVDTLIGGLRADFLFGAGGNDSIFGRAGNDLLVGGDGDDELFGEAGNDTLIGGLGTDTLDGGTGDNVLQDD